MERQARDWADPNRDTRGGLNGMESSVWGVRGYDKSTGLRWRVLGAVSVSVWDGTGKVLLAHGRTMSINDAHRASVPESLRSLIDVRVPGMHVSYAGEQWHEKGYGRHALKNGAGQTLLIVEIEP